MSKVVVYGEKRRRRRREVTALKYSNSKTLVR
jgi:hypothetical protein